MIKSSDQKNKITHELFNLKGVGKQIAKHLERLNIVSKKDLLFHFPARYQDRTQLQKIRDLAPHEEAVIEGVLQNIIIPRRGRTKLLCELHDGTGKLFLRFFHLLKFQADQFKIGNRVRCYSTVRVGQYGLEMFHPEFKIISEDKIIPIEPFLTPIYSATEGLSQYTLRKLTQNALSWMEKEKVFTEVVPESLLKSFSLSFQEAITFLHKPPKETNIHHLHDHQTVAQKRLIFEELLAHRLGLLRLKHDFQTHQAFPLLTQKKLIPIFLQQLPFQLTEAQQRVSKEIANDLSRSHPMLRLVQGDVGSGKTVVAALSLLQAIENGYQAVMMAPTELLAEQHHRTLKQWFEPLGIKVVFLSGKIKGRARTSALTAIKNGEAQIILGTHALFQEEVEFAKLSLVVIDEQHRFGVQQRALLRQKGERLGFYPHQLIMTATPIPRTLAMSFYADLDCSIIDELPKGRMPISTRVIANRKRDDVIAYVRSACLQGQQAYWVCPLIEESETLNCQAAKTTAEELQILLTDIKVGLIHGRLSSPEKEVMMKAFQAKEIQLLVATTVIEVGVDVPNASIMIIENAERLGLSQLHQLRGRVGRGHIASYCILLYQYLSPIAKERLSVMRETNDGFKIAERDLQLRGPGEVLGLKQTGEITFKVADLLRDNDLLPKVQQAAEEIIQTHPNMIDPLIERWVGNAGNDARG